MQGQGHKAGAVKAAELGMITENWLTEEGTAGPHEFSFKQKDDLKLL